MLVVDEACCCGVGCGVGGFLLGEASGTCLAVLTSAGIDVMGSGTDGGSTAANELPKTEVP